MRAVGQYVLLQPPEYSGESANVCPTGVPGSRELPSDSVTSVTAVAVPVVVGGLSHYYWQYATHATTDSSIMIMMVITHAAIIIIGCTWSHVTCRMSHSKIMMMPIKPSCGRQSPPPHVSRLQAAQRLLPLSPSLLHMFNFADRYNRSHEP